MVMLKNYEFLYTTNASLSADEFEKIKEKMDSIVATDGGSIIEEKDLGDRTLLLKRKKTARGTMRIYQLSLSTQGLDNLRNYVLVTESILSHYIVKSDSVVNPTMTPFEYKIA
tara:strand:+ start:578 stop:916 length:339 start_codon:yes stop_codon:yes gene_type:complete